MGKAVNGSKTDTATKNQKRSNLTQLLQQLGYYVQTTANNDLAKALSSGFEITKDRTPSVVPNPPSNVTVKQAYTVAKPLQIANENHLLLLIYADIH